MMLERATSDRQTWQDVGVEPQRSRYHRFLDRYEARQAERAGRRQLLKRAWRTVAGSGLVVLGLVVSLIPGPGPGQIITLVGLFFLASEYRRIARGLDIAEAYLAPKLLRVWRALRTRLGPRRS